MTKYGIKKCSYKIALTILLTTGLLLASVANAVCVKTDTWQGPTIRAPSAGSLNLPIINITNNTFQPVGSLLATSILPITTYGNQVPYEHDKVLYICDAADANDLFEFYAIGDWVSSQNNSILDNTWAVGNDYIMARIQHNQTGEFFHYRWKKRALTDLDRDEQGRILVKAKNFADIKLDVFKALGGEQLTYVSGRNTGVIVFAGPGLSNPIEGAEAGPTYNAGAGTVGAVNFGEQVTIRYTNGTCNVSNSVPYVLFPTTSVNELEQGNSVSVNITLTYMCQGQIQFEPDELQPGGFGVAFSIDSTSFNEAKRMGLIDNEAVSHLLSQNYGSPGYAQGVGVILEREDSHTQPFILQGFADSITNVGYQYGWRPFMGTNVETGDDVSYFHEAYTVKFTKLPGATVTAGRYYAQAQLLVRVQ